MTLTEKRRSLNMALGDCAKQAGIKPSDLSRIEVGRKVPDLETCTALGQVIGMSAEEVRSGLPSPEDADRNYAQLSDSLLAMVAVHDDAKTKGFKRGNAGQSSIECPICKGTIKYSVAAVNGHIWAACSNPDCVRWME